MKRYIAIALLGLTLAGCAQLQAVSQGISLATKTITNPVTKDEEAKLELIVDTGLQLLKAYKRACVQGAADVNCKTNIASLQPYTRAIVPLKDQLRSFVDNNDQINATAVYNQLTALYVNLKTAAQSVGINVGS